MRDPIWANRANGRPFSAPSPIRKGLGGGDAMRDAQAGVPSARRRRAQLAFKDSMVHGILQFTPSIAFRYVLHRCESRDIRCRESFRLKDTSHPTTTPRTGVAGHDDSVLFSLALAAPGFVSPPGASTGRTRHLDERISPTRRATVDVRDVFAGLLFRYRQ